MHDSALISTTTDKVGGNGDEHALDADVRILKLKIGREFEVKLT